MSGLGRPDVRAGEAGHVALGFRGVWISGQGPDIRGLGKGRMSGLAGRLAGTCRHLEAEQLKRKALQGPHVRGLGRMSGAWEMLLAPSVGSPHPWTWGLVHLHAHLRGDPLGT